MATRSPIKPPAQDIKGSVGKQAPVLMEQVSGNGATFAASAAMYKSKQSPDAQRDRAMIAKHWQIEAYRHVKICGEARYSSTLFAAIAGRAEVGVSEPQALRDKPVWVTNGPEVDVFAEIAPTVRDRTRLIRDYMIHRTIAGECYLIARKRVSTDPGYITPPDGHKTWDEFIAAQNERIDLFDPEAEEPTPDPNTPIWEIVAVTEVQRQGDGRWQVRHDNDAWLDLSEDDPVIRMWTPDPERRREAWSPFQALLPTLREIEWLTLHIFTQVRSRLMSAGVWFLPDNLTFPAPPPSSVEGGEETIAAMNDAERFMASLAASSMSFLEAEEVAFPSIVMADPAALESVDQTKLIQFWSDIDDKAMILRSDAVRRFALGMDLPPEQVLGSSGLAVSNSGGSAGSVNHWGEWAKEEQTIQNHIEPALDDFVGVITEVLRAAVDGSLLVIAYGTASLRLRQDRSKESMELFDRGILKAEVVVRENGFDPTADMPDEAEHRMWLLNRIVSGQFLPEQMSAALALLGVDIPAPVEQSSGSQVEAPKDRPGRDQPPSLDDHPYEGPPRGDHEHNDAPFAVQVASAEVLVLRALEKYGNRLLNSGKRGKDRDRTTVPHEAHLTATPTRTIIASEFDFSLAGEVGMADEVRSMGVFCANLYNRGEAYTRAALIEHLKTQGAA